MKHYDVIVIGSGGGAKIISPAARLGLKVACIEKAALGGTCLNRGCIPSKMLIHPADVATQIAQASKFDINVSAKPEVRFDRLVSRIANTVDADSAKIAAGYMRNPNIDFYRATGKFVFNKIIEAAGEQITAEKIILAVGARPAVPAIEGLAGTPYMTSTEALRNTQLPKRMIIIGAGYIAVELGHAYGALGTDVHFLVRSRFLRHEDVEAAEEFTRVFSQRHQVHWAAIPAKVEYQNREFTVTYRNKSGGLSHLTAEALLVATGITPNTDTLGLENTDIKLTTAGFIEVDDHLQTSVEGIYALGDCIGRYFYRHTVNFEGEYLFRTLFMDKTDEPIHYPPVPHAVFTYPQVAGVGKTEEQLKTEGADYVAGLSPYQTSAMGMALLSDHGFCKILIERKTKKILGAHIVGAEASTMIHMLIAFMNKNATLDDLLNMIYIHPALPEIVRNAARKAKEALEKQAVEINLG